MSMELHKILLLERLLQDLRADTARSHGWWFSNNRPEIKEASEELEQPFPLTGFMLMRFRERLWQMVSQCGRYTIPFSREDLPEWLHTSSDTDLDGLTNLIDFLFKINQETALPIQPALLAGLDDLLKWAIEDLQRNIDTIILQHIEAQH